MTRILRALFCALFAVSAWVALAAPPAIPPGPPADKQAIVRSVSGPTINCLGDSICPWSNVSNPAGSTYFSSSHNVGTGAASMLGWVAALSNNAFTLEFSQGYPGSYGALTSVTTLTGGSCTASPRTQGSWTAAMDKVRLQVNRTLAQLARQSRAASNRAPVLYIDSDHSWTDPSLSSGKATKVVAGLHPGVQGAMDNAVSFLNTVRNVRPAGQHIYQPNSQCDVHDATNNPTGNLLGTAGLMLGTGGSNTNCAGTVATAWQVAISCTGTPTCAASIETNRTDGLPGQRQVATF
jgi:hypothetical protein